jgi:hypothetical protein
VLQISASYLKSDLIGYSYKNNYFLDFAQAFDKVCHQAPMSKLNKILPKQYVHLLESYVTERIYRVKQEDEYSQFKDIKAGVPQSSVLRPVLFLLYTHYIPKGNITMATFADDTAILAVSPIFFCRLVFATSRNIWLATDVSFF